jgi:hypothetical protein
VLDVVRIGKFEVSQEQFLDGEIGPDAGSRNREPSAVGDPFNDDAIVFGPTLRKAESAEVEVPSI